MITNVNESLKKKVQKENSKQSKGLYYLWIFEKIALSLNILYIIAFPIYCIVTGYLVSTNMRTGEKSYFLICMDTSIVASMGLTFVLLVHVVRKRIEGVKIGERVDEAIEIIDEKLFYTFRIKYETLENKRILVILDLNTINNLHYDEKTYEITIGAMMLEKVIDVSTNIQELRDAEMTSRSITIFDYFSPSLYNLLKSKVK